MSKRPTYIVVMGTFRTGSTFLAKALSAHESMSVASDAYFYFFKALRNEIMAREGYKDFDAESPVSDNFFSPYADVNAKIRKYDLRIPIRHNKLEEILENTGRLALRDAPMVVPLLKGIRAKSYDELFEQLMDAVKRAYGGKDTSCYGFKVLFAEQFLQVLLNTYKDLKCIYLIRDPRGVVASQNVFFDKPDVKRIYKERGRYPLLYVIRQWRKSFAYLLDNADKRQNVMPLRYEALTSDPGRYFRKICDFVGVRYDRNMRDARLYRNGEGKLWTQNSSYGTSKAISTRFVNKWKAVLTEEEVRIIEDLCSPEMELLGYRRTKKEDILFSVTNGYREDLGKIDPWIRPYMGEYLLDREQAQKELIRHLLIKEKLPATDALQKVLIGEDYLLRLRKVRRLIP